MSQQARRAGVRRPAPTSSARRPAVAPRPPARSDLDTALDTALARPQPEPRPFRRWGFRRPW